MSNELCWCVCTRGLKHWAAADWDGEWINCSNGVVCEDPSLSPALIHSLLSQSLKYPQESQARAAQSARAVFISFCIWLLGFLSCEKMEKKAGWKSSVQCHLFQLRTCEWSISWNSGLLRTAGTSHGAFLSIGSGVRSVGTCYSRSSSSSSSSLFACPPRWDVAYSCGCSEIHYTTQPGHELLVLLPQLPKCCDYSLATVYFAWVPSLSLVPLVLQGGVEGAAKTNRLKLMTTHLVGCPKPLS